ncbi:MAG: DUF4263 domain-containing protein [Methanocellales archaeon]|nr:DUF4263 domain-containing protein [Methanocellales archaeon]
MTWFKDVVVALRNLGGEARWTDLVNETCRIRDQKGEHISYFCQLRINFVLNENRDGKGKDVFTKPCRGIYKLKHYPSLEYIFREITETTEERELLSGIQQKLSKISEFLDIISNDSCTESEAGRFVKEEPWILGLDYLKADSEEDIGLNGRTDFLMEKIGGDFDIIELKGPNEKIFLQPENRGYSRMNAICKDSLSQIINYLSKYDKYYLFQREETKRDVLYPKGVIVIGRDKNTDLNALKTHNNFFHRIEIVTYDHLIERTRTSLQNIDNEK